MSLTKRKDSKYYWTRFTAPNGRAIFRSTGTVNRKQAQEFEDLLKTQFWRAESFNEYPDRSWKDAALRWIRETDKRTVSDDIGHLRHLSHEFTALTLTQINADVFSQFIQRRRGEGVKNATINRSLAVARSILNKAAGEWAWIDTAPKVPRLKVEKSRVIFLTKGQAASLIDTLKGNTRDMVRFTLSTGLRESNVTALEWSQVDIHNRIAWIWPDQSKSGSPIGIPLNRDALEVLASRRGEHARYVFVNHGKPVRKAGTKAYKRALDRAGICKYTPPPSERAKQGKASKYPTKRDDQYAFDRFRWHDLRHTWASWHVMSGTPLNVLMELGGWHSLDMVMIYAHLSTGHLQEHAENIATPTADNVVSIRRA